MLSGTNIVIGVTGGIACYKACEIVSRLKKLEANVNVIMTKNATEFVSSLSFETLSGNEVSTDMFALKSHFEVKHISLAKKADLCVIAPATANIIAKLASGIADDMLSTTLLATKATIIICPAMNTAMYENVATQKNIATLKERGMIFVEPNEGRLACGDIGKGKLAEPCEIVQVIEDILKKKNDYVGKKVLVTSGGTQEAIDAVRYITNRSSGKMGLELAKAIVERGGEVTLVVGNISVDIPNYIKNVIKVKTTQEMYEAVIANYEACDIIIKAAAPGDYKVEKLSPDKIKTPTLTLQLIKNVDIAAEVGKKKGSRKLVIFCAETNDLIKNAKQKLVTKNADMVVANDVLAKGAGFEVDTNIATIITKNGKTIEGALMSKSQLASQILDEILVL